MARGKKFAKIINPRQMFGRGNYYNQLKNNKDKKLLHTRKKLMVLAFSLVGHFVQMNGALKSGSFSAWRSSKGLGNFSSTDFFSTLTLKLL